MAPEQISADRAVVGPETDVWAFGVILYEALTEESPYEGITGMQELYGAILKGRITLPSDSRVDVTQGDYGAICLKCLEKDPCRRYANAGVLADELDRALAGRPLLHTGTRLERRGRQAFVALVVVALALCTLIVAALVSRAARGTTKSAELQTCLGSFGSLAWR